MSPGRAAAARRCTAARSSPPRSMRAHPLEHGGERPARPCRSARRSRTLPLESRASGAKSCPLPSPPAITTTVRASPKRPRWSRPRWCPRIIDETHARDVGDPLRAMCEAGEGFERGEHRGSEASRFSQRQGRQRIGGIVQARDSSAARCRAAARRGARAGAPPSAQQREIDVVSGAQSRTPCGAPRPPAHRRHQGSSAFSTTIVAACANIRALAARVGLDRPVAVHVVGGDVEHHGGLEPKRGGRLELKARQLQHVQVGSRLLEQIQGGNPKLPPASTRHPALRPSLQPAGHRALAVGAGDPDHRRAHRTGEQLDVAEAPRFRAPARPRCNRLLERYARATSPASELPRAATDRIPRGGCRSASSPEPAAR